jgi:hypothetical protein
VEWDIPAEGDSKTAYLRHRFTVTEPMFDLLVRLQFDDGFIAYLDGQELRRSNLPLDEGDHYDLMASVAQANAGETTTYRLLDLGRGLQPGEHVLALSLHNFKSDSSDLRVADIRLLGTSVRAAEALVATANGGDLRPDEATLRSRRDLAFYFAAKQDWEKGRHYLSKLRNTSAVYPKDANAVDELAHALLLVKLGLPTAHANHCKAMLERYETSDDRPGLSSAAKALLIDPGSGTSPFLNRAVASAKKGAALEPHNPWALLAESLAEFRSGDHSQALATLTKIETEFPSCRSASLAIQTMATHSLGNSEQAAELLRRTESALAKFDRVWFNQLAAQMLCEEARNLIGVE